jgi:three-Cys-motif partner protein
MAIKQPWLEKQLLSLRHSLLTDLLMVDKDIYYEKAGYWPIKKLLFLKAYLSTVYTTIIPNRWKNFYYIDLLADSGICKTKDRFVLGSALIAALYTRVPFTKMFFVDTNQKSLLALEKRINHLQKLPNYPKISYKLMPKDCNIAIDEILNEMLPNSHYLAFIDCERMEAEWHTIEKLLERQGDLIINFQSCGAARAIQAPQCDIPHSKVAKFFGVEVNEIKDKGPSRDELLNQYISNIKKSGRDLCFSVRIKSDEGSFYYDLVFATRVTKGGSPWKKAVLSIKKNVERTTCKMIETAFNVIEGKQKKLFS